MAAEGPLHEPSQRYLNRELSWLRFNERVLEEARNPQNPLLERLKFLAIFEANLDEFFMVRVSGFIEQDESRVGELTPDGLSPSEQISLILKHALPMRQRASLIFEKELKPELRKAGVAIRSYSEIGPKSAAKVEELFDRQVFPLLTPLLVNPAMSVPFISGRSLNLAVELRADDGSATLARVKVPSGTDRFVRVPGKKFDFVPLEELIARHLHWVSRLHLAIGIMSYVTSPLWALFLILSGLQAWELTQRQPIYFAEGWPFPILPVSVADEALLLLAITLGLLFVPKLLGLLLALVDGPRRRALGGGPRLVLTALLEQLFSALLAPVMMVLHSWFVLSILLGTSIEWKPQRRSAAQSAFGLALKAFLWPTLIGLGAAVAVWHAAPLLFWWLSPVTAGLVLSVPLALLGASERLGEAAARHRLLLVREDTEPPAVMWELDARPSEAAAEPPLARFVRTVMEPATNALHLRLVRAFRTKPPLGPAERRLLERKATYLGPEALDAAERRAILEDPELLERLHLEAWARWPDEQPAVMGFLRTGQSAPSRPPTEPGHRVEAAA